MVTFSPILLFGCCLLVFLVVAVSIAVIYSRRKEGSKAEVVPSQLAEQMGLTPLDSKRPSTFGGMHQDHAFYIYPGIAGSVSSRNVRLSKAVAVSVEVQMRQPRQGYAYCNRGRVSPAASFDAAFGAKLQHEWISVPAREAMLTFVRKREDLFLEGLPIRPKPGEEAVHEVRLQHNIPNAAQVTPESVLTVLDELVEVARVIEATC